MEREIKLTITISDDSMNDEEAKEKLKAVIESSDYSYKVEEMQISRTICGNQICFC